MTLKQLSFFLTFALGLFSITEGYAKGHHKSKPEPVRGPIQFDLKDVPELKGVPWADRTGLVVNTYKLTIPESTYPYNPSIVPYKDGYLLAYRHDPQWLNFHVRTAVIGLVRLDKNFEVQGTTTFLKAGEGSSEDPRLFWYKDALYMTYTHVTAYGPLTCNTAICELDPETFAVKSDKNISYGKLIVTKNWIPFVVNDDIFFMYKYLNQEILKYEPRRGTVSLAYESKSCHLMEKWEKKWGDIRGGTPPLKIGNDYLAIFHSSFESGPIRYYVMGAITFSAKPPFKVTAISQYPIFFKNIYETPVTPNNYFYPRNHLRVLFPSGLCEGVENGKEVYYVICGENDVALKSVVLDKEQLFKSLERVK